MRATLIVIATVVALGTAGSATAQMRRHLPLSAPLQVRIDGYLDSKPAGEPVAATWKLTAEGKGRPLYITELRVLTGNLAYWDVLQAAEPYHGNFQINGPEVTLKQLTAAPPGQKIRLLGILRIGVRRFLVSRIQDLPAATPTP